MPESEWRAPCYKGRRNACRRKREAAAAAARLSRSSSNDKTSEREKSDPATMQIGVTALGTATNNASNPSKSWAEWVRGKGYGTRNRNRRGKRTTNRSRRRRRRH